MRARRRRAHHRCAGYKAANIEKTCGRELLTAGLVGHQGLEPRTDRL